MIRESLITGVFESKQGTYSISKQPLAYWGYLSLVILIFILLCVLGITSNS